MSGGDVYGEAAAAALRGVLPAGWSAVHLGAQLMKVESAGGASVVVLARGRDDAAVTSGVLRLLRSRVAVRFASHARWGVVVAGGASREAYAAGRDELAGLGWMPGGVHTAEVLGVGQL